MIIGFCGPIGAGKTTCAGHVADRYGYRHRSFAEPVYTAAAAVNPWVYIPVGHKLEKQVLRRALNTKTDPIDCMRLTDVVDNLGWQEAKRTLPEVRRVLQRVGCEAGRDIHGPDVWVNQAVGGHVASDRWVFDDVRFDNEAQAIRERGGIVVRIFRPDHWYDLDHTSELGVADAACSHVVYNDTTIKGLTGQLAKIMESVP